MDRIIGRTEQKAKLDAYVSGDNSEFVVVYGRRRVGKTFLIREYLGNKFDFHITGLANAGNKEQLINFHAAIQKYSPTTDAFADSWYKAFQQLIDLLEHSASARKIIFIDELPWLDTPKSGFLSAFEHFWNDWASARKDILLIVCGSATSWITGKLLNNKGGLHNRVTRKMSIAPFTLKECEEYLISKKISLNRYQIVESYMILGGIPFYLSLFEKGMSLAQNIDNLFFKESGELRNEFNNLYASLFKNHENYVKVVEALAKKAKGLSREEILTLTKLSDGGSLSKILMELEVCKFIRKYNAMDKKKKDGLYQLTDFYTLFYFKYIQKNEYNDPHFWSASIDSAQHKAWSGYAFEQVCLEHIEQIKRKLGISGVQCKTASWRSNSAETGAQIDLLIERKDQIINLCEMKYSTDVFSIDKSYDLTLRNKIGAFRQESKTRKAVHLTMVTTYGIKQNEYAGMIQNEVVMDDLFE
ncbi:MAG: ATP-binding protein [Paludibacter sp.]